MTRQNDKKSIKTGKSSSEKQKKKNESAEKKVPKKSPAKRSAWRVVLNVFLWLLSLAVIIGMCLACFGGNFDPQRYGFLAVFELTLPIWLIGLLVVTLLDVFWCRKAFVFCVLTFIACANAIWDYSPLNIRFTSNTKYASCPKFTLLTYNVMNFEQYDGIYPDDYNPTIQYIIKKNADIVCLQETGSGIEKPRAKSHITAEQLDTLYRMYPYRLLYGKYLTLLSKYPAESMHTPPIVYKSPSNKDLYPIGVFRVNIEGTPVTLFNVHLQSYSLTNEDKALYKNLAEGKEIAEVAEGNARSSLQTIKAHILRKVKTAYEKRGIEADALCRYIEKFGGLNVIVAGDFNDVPGCYTIRELEDYGLKQVYPRVGFGPMITYNADMFYFRIDHVLYRGEMEPLSLSRGNDKFSDHYPLTVTFALTNQTN